MDERGAIILKTLNRNNYLYSSYRNQLLYIHPLIDFFINSNDFNISAKKQNNTNINSIKEFNRKELKYYFDKYNFLKKNNFFDQISIKQKTCGRLVPEQIPLFLANSSQIVFEVTDACNLKCKYCGYGKLYNDYDTRRNKKINYGFAINLINYLVEFWNSPFNKSYYKTIDIAFYGGEPLLNIEFIKKITNYIDKIDLKYNISFTFTITTNGTLLEKNIDFLVKRKFNLLISLDGNYENNIYRKYANGKSSFDIVVNNIKKIQNKYPAYFEKFVNINAVLHNKNSFREIYTFINKNFNKRAIVSELNPFGIAPNKKTEFIRMFKNRFESLHETMEESIILNELFILDPLIYSLYKFVEVYSGYAYQNFTSLYLNKNSASCIPSGTCLPFRKIFLTVNGKILPCERIGQNNTLGWVNDKGVFIDFSKVTEGFNKLYDKYKRFCSTCFRFDNCTKCLFHENNTNLLDCEKHQNKKKLTFDFSELLTLLENNPFLYSKIIKIASDE